MIVSARQKPVEQLPEWALCCEAARKVHAAEAESGCVVRVEAGSSYLVNTVCCYCHRIEKDVRACRIVDGLEERSIAIELADFDEGESCL
jgi:hypothetical protein